jgi:hypothetical protein
MEIRLKHKYKNKDNHLWLNNWHKHKKENKIFKIKRKYNKNNKKKLEWPEVNILYKQDNYLNLWLPKY